MEIKSTSITQSGQPVEFIYTDVNSELDFCDLNIHGVHAYCFYKDKLVVVYSDKKGYWTPPGGQVEEGENVREAIRREIKEETNMNATQINFIGYQNVIDVDDSKYQARAVCIVEPYGPFVSDPDGDIDRIEFIDPKDYKKYFDWGEIGDHLIIRALEFKAQMEVE